MDLYTLTPALASSLIAPPNDLLDDDIDADADAAIIVTIAKTKSIACIGWGEIHYFEERERARERERRHQKRLPISLVLLDYLTGDGRVVTMHCCLKS